MTSDESDPQSLATTVRAAFDDDTRWQLTAPRDVIGPVMSAVVRRRRRRALAASAGTLAVVVAVAIVAALAFGLTGRERSMVDPAGPTAQAEISQARQALTTALVARARPLSHGGADSFHIASAHQHAGMVDFAGTYRAWSGVVSQTKPNGTTVTAHPSARLDFTATMTQDSHGTWSMTSYDFTFHPGSAP